MAVRLMPRDMTALTILAENYGAPIDLVAEMLGVSMPRAYSLERRWREAGMVNQHRIRPVPGPHWVFPRRSAAEALLGFPVYRHWIPTAKMADHVATVLRVRLGLVGLDLDRWIGERQLRAEVGPVKFGEKRQHIHDGRYINADGELWAVEVELTPKSPTYAARAFHAAWHAARKAECAGLAYYCRGEAVKNVIRQVGNDFVTRYRADFDQGPKVKLFSLNLFEDTATRTTATGRPDLRVIDGGTAAERPAL
ncbi:hypothetical protein IU474_14420 [Nocardia otitidiscaviarum]|uniref:hypothetical protein n=1 Tax=Nocardia otitidiscaviarum TaxID=1823 RepID=UPI00189311B4|nr:hypothetical protein [Nocardia otitidiscaviarum]MBF6238251.1 hypothetical protein [Nocardia otitidiscaviarum]